MLGVLLLACSVRPAPNPSSPAADATPTPSVSQTEVRSAPRPGLSIPFARPTPATARPPVAADARLQALRHAIAQALEEWDGEYGVLVEYVPTGQQVVHDADLAFEAASVYKLAVAYEVLRQVDAGQFSLDERLTVADEDTVEPEPQAGLGADDEVSVSEALEAMMGISSNSAAHALMRLVGREQLNRSMDQLGLHQTRVPPAAESDESAMTSPADMARLLDLLANGLVLSADSRQRLRELLALTEELDPLVACVPEGTQVLSKVGNQERSSSVAGLVETPRGPIIISVLDANVDPGDARAIIAAIAGAAFQVFTE